ncbi:sensor histidine kinase [Clostridium gasigenes]|uniref:sensor histidine kinase n=1 Tax=Clostridium gasigenes TaxID=94869 RepID=UPI001FAC88B3|nr:HAMP domain-containing sensor histidine kinase [Clostridium gasigenes]
MKNNNNYKTQKMEIKEQKKIFEKQMKEEKINFKRERQIENAQNRGLVNRVKLFARRFWIKFSKSRIGNKINEFIYWLMKRIEKSIRFELMVVFAVCFAISVIFYGISNNILSRDYTSSSIKYDYETIKDKALRLVNEISYEKEKSGHNGSAESNSIDRNGEVGAYRESIENTLLMYKDSKIKVYLTDLDGKVIYKSNGAGEEKLDIYAILDKSNNIASDGEERTLLYPIKIGETRNYLIYSEIPTPRINIETYKGEKSFFALILSVLVFISAFIVITNRKIKYLDDIVKGVNIVSCGDLAYRVEEKGKDEITSLAVNINTMTEEIERRIQSERAAEKTKGELITNVSHDLRTPLTSVMGYIGLIKDGKYENETMMKEYLDIAFSKSNQLKELIEDLFEYTKLNNNGIVIDREKVNLVDFLAQIIEEYMPLFDENSLKVVKKFADDKTEVNIDTGKIVRVFENLFSNAIKYSFKPGEVVISSYQNNGYANIIIKNSGETITKEKMDKLFDRFYRADEARNSNVKGSGLGLAISKNIIELHEGKIWAECIGNDISFFIKLRAV